MIRALRKWRLVGCYLLVIVAVSVPTLMLTLGSRFGSDGREWTPHQSTYKVQGDGVPAFHLQWGPVGEAYVTTSDRSERGSEAPVAIDGRSDAHVNDTGDSSVDVYLEMEARGKIQQARMEAFCTKYNQFHRGPRLPTFKEGDDLYRHLIVDDKERVIFCFVEKSGCTDMKRLMFVNMGLLPRETISWQWVDNTKYLEKALKKSNFAQKSLSLSSRLQRLVTHFKFMVVRNPLERLVSGYKNKIESPLNAESRLAQFGPLQMEILRKYRPRDIERWLDLNMSYPLTVSFMDFVQYLVDEDNRHINPHFRPMINICRPCHIKYDFYANFKSLGEDTAYIIRKIHAKPEYYRNKSLHTNATQTGNLLGQYYAQLPENLRHRLFKDWKTELDFYYHLFPDERNSHVLLLGIDQNT